MCHRLPQRVSSCKTVPKAHVLALGHMRSPFRAWCSDTLLLWSTVTLRMTLAYCSGRAATACHTWRASFAREGQRAARLGLYGQPNCSGTFSGPPCCATSGPTPSQALPCSHRFPLHGQPPLMSATPDNPAAQVIGSCELACALEDGKWMSSLKD